MRAASKKTPHSFEIVKVVDLAEIIPRNNSPSFSFRVEVLRERRPRGSFRVRVYRMETFRIQPTFPQKAGKPKYQRSDEAFFVEDVVGGWEKIEGRSANEVLRGVERRITSLFRHGSR